MDSPIRALNKSVHKFIMHLKFYTTKEVRNYAEIYMFNNEIMQVERKFYKILQNIPKNLLCIVSAHDSIQHTTDT